MRPRWPGRSLDVCYREIAEPAVTPLGAVTAGIRRRSRVATIELRLRLLQKYRGRSHLEAAHRGRAQSVQHTASGSLDAC